MWFGGVWLVWGVVARFGLLGEIRKTTRDKKKFGERGLSVSWWFECEC